MGRRDVQVTCPINNGEACGRNIRLNHQFRRRCISAVGNVDGAISKTPASLKHPITPLFIRIAILRIQILYVVLSVRLLPVVPPKSILS